LKSREKQIIFRIEHGDLGMNIGPSLIDFCEKEKNCKFLKKLAVLGLCKNPICYLSLQYQVRYKDEGYKWEDMYFNSWEGCFCFENAARFSDCPMKNAANSLCKKVIEDYPEPIKVSV